MIKINLIFLLFVSVVTFYSCSDNNQNELNDLVQLADGWRGKIIASIDQSYAGWDVEIGDADNDKQNEILITGSPNSRLYLLKLVKSKWQTHLLADNLARSIPGMGLTVKVVDLNQDGKNEIIVGTGQESGDTTAYFYLKQMGEKLLKS